MASDSASTTTPAVIQPPTVVETDDWTQSSSSANQPTKQELLDTTADPPKEDASTAPPVVSTETEAVEAKAEEPKPKQTASERHAEMQARFAAETKAYHDARRLREAEEEQTVKLRAEREALKPKEGEAKAKPTTDDDEVPVWSKWEADDKGTFDEFMVARDAAVLKRATKDLEARNAQAAQQAESQRFAQQHQQRIEQVKVAHPDFMEKVTANLRDVESSPFVDFLVQHHDQGAELLYHFANNPDEARVASTLTPSRPIADAIIYSDAPIELLSYFAQHPAECDRLSRLHPATALVALGELKMQLRGANTGSPSVPSVSNAKAPIRPVGGAQRATVVNPLDGEFGPEYVRAANAAEAEANKRRYL